MAKYAIYLTGSGTAAARPATGLFEIPDLPADDFATRLADQVALLGAGEAHIQVLETAELTDLDSDANTYDYTVDTTATPPVALTPVSVARFTLEQRQAKYRIKRESLIQDALPYANFGRNFSDGEINSWLDYLRDLRDLADNPANPEGVSFPTKPSTSGSDSLSVWARLWRRGNVLGAVSKLLGVPTGALADEGQNANGYYWKFTDGTLLCTHRMEITYSSAAQLADTWTFPHAFGSTYINRRSVQVTMSNRNNSNTIVGAQITNAQIGTSQVLLNTQGATGTVSIIVRDASSSFVTGDLTWVELTAMGRWD